MTLYIILAILWFLSGAITNILVTLYIWKNDFKVSDIFMAIICGMGGGFCVCVSLLVVLSNLNWGDKILIKRRK